ncbi:MAG: class I SAM-dependent methyltransferase [Gammaproteobacteria bacterium]
MSNIIIYQKSSEFQLATKKLAKNLHLPIKKNLPQEYTLILYYDKNGLYLQQLGSDAPKKPIKVDFSAKKITYRRKLNQKTENLAKAIGIKAKPHVLDATAGLGRDAFILASLGCTVIMLEKSPIITALLQDGLERATHDPALIEIISRIQLIQTDNIKYMQQLKSHPDVVYLDPMFPVRKKSALVKKEMRILTTLLENEPPINEKLLLETARGCAKKRVVVKRPRLAKPLDNQKPNFSITGKICRFDVYVIAPPNSSFIIY